MIGYADSCVFVKTADLNVQCMADPNILEANKNLSLSLESVRRQASIKMGLSDDYENASAAIPKM